MDFIQEMQQTKREELNKVVSLMANTVKAKYLFQKGGWALVHKEFTDKEYCNPNFGITYLELQRFFSDLNVSVLENMKEIESLVNQKLGTKAIEYRIDRLNHYFSIVI